MALDLKKLAQQVDDALAKETKESLEAWLRKFRESQPPKRMKEKEQTAKGSACEKFVIRNFPGFEKETWYPVVVAIAEGWAKEAVSEKLLAIKGEIENKMDEISAEMHALDFEMENNPNCEYNDLEEKRRLYAFAWTQLKSIKY